MNKQLSIADKQQYEDAVIQMQRMCKSSTASIVNKWYCSDVSLPQGRETFQIIALTSAKNEGLERYPCKKGLADLSTPLL